MFHGATGVPDARLDRYDHLIVHVTATPPDRDIGAAEVDAMHRQRGFSMCGYNAVIRRNGDWEDADDGFKTRPIGRAGAHVGGCGPGWNGRSFGVSLVGGVDSQNRPEFNMTAVQMETLRDGIERFLSLHRNSAGVKIMGHRDLIRLTNAAPKACPCFDVIPWWNNQPHDETEDEDLHTPPTPMDLGESWTVIRGDTLFRISRATGVSVSTILHLNPSITDASAISVGQVISLS